MADIKTHLRELSVAATVGMLKSSKKYSFEDLLNSNKFYVIASEMVKNDISSAKNILDIDYYDGEYKKIIENGYKLGKKIVDTNYFHINSFPEIIWVGNDTQKNDPIDIKINGYGFSLKEDSFILKNMGLYELLNNLTGSNYQRGLHVFSEFSSSEYEEWFQYAWQHLIGYLKQHLEWNSKKNDRSSRMIIDNDYIVMQYNDAVVNVPIGIETTNEYMLNTTSIIREKVFSKWINEIISEDDGYITRKKDCSITAGEKVSKLINDNFNYSGVLDFLRIYSFEYFYAKSTNNETTILKVPNVNSFHNSIEFVGCRYDVPGSQLNIISTFKNKKTGKRMEFRNECRFSHGQFNGTPEAKMYVGRNSSLIDLYDTIE